MAVIDHEKLDDYRFLGTLQIVGADAPFDNAVAFARKNGRRNAPFWSIETICSPDAGRRMDDLTA
ncbi:hypothetical protein [Paracoccus versutus]|uniref:hypothetical protein n=1 Tax=Paracoccus versutus TaxID=34007 RepID=UPI000A4127D5|nr:hypothetical protein [Paracoccus versutus]